MSDDILATSELLVLLAVLRLDEEAYGVAIADAVSEARGKPASVAGVYNAIERLEQRGLVRTELGEPTSIRGGRAKRFVRLTRQGHAAIRATQRALTTLWSQAPGSKVREV